MLLWGRFALRIRPGSVDLCDRGQVSRRRAHQWVGWLAPGILTDEELGQRVFVNSPLLVADGRLKGSIYRLEIYSCRYNLTSLDGFWVRRRGRDGDGLGRQGGCREADGRSRQLGRVDVGHFGGGRRRRAQLAVFGEAGLERTAYCVRRQAGDVACRKDAYRDAAGSIIRACNESVELRDHDSRLRLIIKDGNGCENR